jgi:hypothetical protein
MKGSPDKGLKRVEQCEDCEAPRHLIGPNVSLVSCCRFLPAQYSRREQLPAIIFCACHFLSFSTATIRQIRAVRFAGYFLSLLLKVSIKTQLLPLSFFKSVLARNSLSLQPTRERAVAAVVVVSLGCSAAAVRGHCSLFCLCSFLSSPSRRKFLLRVATRHLSLVQPCRVALSIQCQYRLIFCFSSSHLLHPVDNFGQARKVQSIG